ncbi:MAG: sulfate ABC transporter permease subunit CysW [Planctomycetia bacterium]|nr:sulfate ABC transporter permease subunit CysW [Planctomycetia bacterium]
MVESTKPVVSLDRVETSRSFLHILTEPIVTRVLLLSVTIVFMTLFLLFPLASVFYEALADGVKAFSQALSNKDTLNACKMTLIATGIATPLNVVFGLIASWCIGKFQFWGKGFLVSLIDIPFAISPIIAGLLFVFLFGAGTSLGKWLLGHHIKILYATPSIVMATVFVTFPFVVRELIPVMESQGDEEEQAARVLGASGWQIFWRVTLPNIKWALLYGIILCNARAIGEFGAAVVVSRNSVKTNTLPLHINALYQSYGDGSAPFAVATLLAAIAIVTLIIKTILELKIRSTQTKD